MGLPRGARRAGGAARASLAVPRQPRRGPVRSEIIRAQRRQPVRLPQSNGGVGDEGSRDDRASARAVAGVDLEPLRLGGQRHRPAPAHRVAEGGPGPLRRRKLCREVGQDQGRQPALAAEVGWEGVEETGRSHGPSIDRAHRAPLRRATVRFPAPDRAFVLRVTFAGRPSAAHCGSGPATPRRGCGHRRRGADRTPETGADTSPAASRGAGGPASRAAGRIPGLTHGWSRSPRRGAPIFHPPLECARAELRRSLADPNATAPSGTHRYAHGEHRAPPPADGV